MAFYCSDRCRLRASRDLKRMREDLVELDAAIESLPPHGAASQPLREARRMLLWHLARASSALLNEATLRKALTPGKVQMEP